MFLSLHKVNILLLHCNIVKTIKDQLMKPLFTKEAEELFWYYKDNNLKQEQNNFEYINGMIHLKQKLNT